MDKNFPTTLQEAILYFAKYENCHAFMVELRWPDGKVKCPHCGSERVTYLENARLWKCYERHPLAKFSLKVGTIFEDSPVKIDKWLVAVWMIVNCKNGISSYEIARSLGVTQKTAWFMDHRIRFALHQGSFAKMGGEGSTVEVDETFMGGKARNMHASKRNRLGRSGEGFPKTVVMGLLERKATGKQSRVRARVVETTSARILQSVVRDSVEAGSRVYTDEARGYQGLRNDYEHAFINHAEKYVDGTVHTNGVENFWSLLKRTIAGTYVAVEPFHMFRYLDEQSFRFNERFGNDANRFQSAMAGIVDRRLTYKLLTGKQEDQTSSDHTRA